MEKILIVEDDVNLGTTLSGALELQGYEVLYLTCVDNAMDEIQSFQPDLIVLDVMLNGRMDGFELGRLIRSSQNTPVLFTTSRDGTQDLQEGFSISNTDYIRKPYKFVEVKLRMDNLLALTKKEKIINEFFQIGSFCFKPKEQLLGYECENIHLNNHESEVLKLLCGNTDKFIPREIIISSVWNEADVKLKEGSLNNTLTRLRSYLKADKNISVQSRIGLGVKLVLTNK